MGMVQKLYNRSSPIGRRAIVPSAGGDVVNPVKFFQLFIVPYRGRTGVYRSGNQCFYRGMEYHGFSRNPFLLF